MEADEAATLAALREVWTTIVEPALSRGRGRIVKHMGDGFLAEFGSVVDAVTCATEIQLALGGPDDPVNVRTDLSLRIGVHIGEVTVEDGDIYGNGVNIAARLESMSAPGGVCISGQAHDEVSGRIDILFEDLGPQQLRNIDRPVRVWQWQPVGRAAASERRAPAVGIEPGKPSVAVLPFANMSADSSQDYFADGFTEDVILYLSRFRDLIVIGRASSFRFKGATGGASDFGAKLGAGYIVTGSMRRSENRLRISVQLSDGRTGVQLWAERYDRELGDVFQVQDEIVETIVQRLVKRLRRTSESEALRKAPGNLAAYDYVLRARAIIDDSRERLLESRRLYEAAIELDPDCGHAYLGLAATYSFEWTSGWSDAPERTLNLALENARRAIALDDMDSEANRRLGVFHLFRGEREAAIARLNRALDLNPNDTGAMAYRGLYLIYDGRPLEALRQMEDATRRNPYHPTYYFWFIGLAHYAARQYEQALAPLTAAIEAFPNFVTPRRHLAACLAQLGREDEAHRVAASVISLEPDFTITKVSRTFAYRQLSDLEHYCDGLSKAGLPT